MFYSSHMICNSNFNRYAVDSWKRKFRTLTASLENACIIFGCREWTRLDYRWLEKLFSIILESLYVVCQSKIYIFHMISYYVSASDKRLNSCCSKRWFYLRQSMPLRSIQNFEREKSALQSHCLKWISIHAWVRKSNATRGPFYLIFSQMARWLWKLAS